MVDVWEHHEVQAGCVDANRSGSLLAIAGKRMVAVVKTSSPGELELKAGRASKWEVTQVKWSWAVQGAHRLALSTGQNLEVYSCGSGERLMLEVGARAHPRNVTDLDWSFFDPSLLATSSVDDSINIWDLKDGRKPAYSFRVLAGANQVKWSKLLNNVVATGHDGDIRIWDTRKPNGPLKYIAAHVSKIHGLDWSPDEDTSFASCSQDGTVKLWDLSDPGKPRGQVSLHTPAWKVKFSPLGNGIVTLPVPQVGNSEQGLCLWQCSDLAVPVESLRGEGEVVVDLTWLPQPPQPTHPSPALTLFTLSRNHSLRRWHVRHSLLSYIEEDEVLPGEEGGVSSAGACPNRQQTFSIAIAVSLEQDVQSVRNDTFPGLQIEASGGVVGDVVVWMKKQGHVVRLKLCVSASSLHKEGEVTVSFLQETNIPLVARHQLFLILERLLQSESEKQTLYDLMSLLPLVMGQLDLDSMGTGSVQKMGEESSPLARYHFQRPFRSNDDTVPFPSTTGARFSHTGKLITFGRLEAGPAGNRRRNETPRAMSDLVQAVRSMASRSLITAQEVTIKSYYPLPTAASKQRSIKSVSITDISHFYAAHNALAKQYKLTGPSLSQICYWNSNVSTEHPHLSKTWKLLAHSLSESLRPSLNPDQETPWAARALGRQMISSLLQHYATVGDFQTVAVLACVLSAPTRCPPGFFAAASLSTGSNSPYNTIHSTDTLPEGGWLLSLMQRQRSSSFDDFATGSPPSLVSFRDPTAKQVPVTEQDRHDRNVKMVEPSVHWKLEKYKQFYADYLHRQGLLKESVAVLKFSDNIPPPHIGPEFTSVCRSCGNDSRNVLCKECKSFALQCAVCQNAVKGLASVCPSCGHGGHSGHMAGWFEKFDHCPLNCGCTCVGKAV